VGASNPKRVRQAVKDLCSAMVEKGEKSCYQVLFGSAANSENYEFQLWKSFPEGRVESSMFPTWIRAFNPDKVRENRYISCVETRIQKSFAIFRSCVL
jgi:hypothetical protein